MEKMERILEIDAGLHMKHLEGRIESPPTKSRDSKDQGGMYQ
jgi:hypothetical protein